MFTKVADWVNSKLGFDGLLHLMVCKLLMDVCTALSVPVLVAATVTAVAALGKEFIYDKAEGKGSFEKKDLIADAVGIILGFI